MPPSNYPLLSKPLHHTRRNTQSIRDNASKLAEAEAKQAERISFALSKSRSDAAYYKGVEKISERAQEEARECKARFAAHIISHEVERLEDAGLSF